tara:strand:+ start:8792 stop:9034 length:243 start_codon:yes stop_codon:yes gene_type:complete
MNTFESIQTLINEVKEYNQEAGNELHEQVSKVQSAQWSKEELSDLLKSDNDVADTYYNENDCQHAEIRNIQDMIINLYGE